MSPAMIPNLRYDFWIVHCPKVYDHAIVPPDFGLLTCDIFDLLEEVVFEPFVCHD
jgi:hypothetical protein